MVRLLQRFERFTLAEEKQLAPPWKTKPLPTGSSMFGPGYPGTRRKEVEKVWLGNHVVMFSKVRSCTRCQEVSYFPLGHRVEYGPGLSEHQSDFSAPSIYAYILSRIHLASKRACGCVKRNTFACLAFQRSVSLIIRAKGAL